MAKVTRYIGLVLGYICCSITIYAQQSKLLIVCKDEMSKHALSSVPVKTTFLNVNQTKQYVEQLPSLLQAKGYIGASVDTLMQDSTNITIQLYLGKQFKWEYLQVAPTDWPLLNQLQIKQADFSSTFFNPNMVSGVQEKLLTYFENNGYPFATVKFDSIAIINEKISAKLIINKGLLYKLDSIRVFGNAKINKSFLYRYLSFQPKSNFSKEKLETVNQRLLELPYLQQAQPWGLTMLSNAYLMDMYLQPQKSNQIDAIVGLLPANQQIGGKLLLTIDAKLRLQNAFSNGENIALTVQQIQPKSPRLDLNFQQPYILNSNFGLDINFNLFKKDSAWLNINAGIGTQYQLSLKQKVKILFQTFKTNLLDVDTISVKLTKRLPDIIDVAHNALALEYEYLNTNYRFNPRKGTELRLFVSAGNRTIKKNNAITQIKDPSFNYSSLYDSMQLTSYQFKLKLSAIRYFPLGRQSTLKTALNAGLLQSPSYFRNELFQIGGYKLMRGFDEESIFSSRYAVTTVEYRYLLGVNSYFNVFSDVGFSYSNIADVFNSFIGLGAGLAFQTKQGILNISYAAGKRNDTPFDLRQSKIHFGFISLF